MRTPFHVPTFLPTNRAAWGVVTLLLFSLLWFHRFWFTPFNLHDFTIECFDPRQGGSIVGGIRTVVPISLVVLGVACVVSWVIQGVCVAAFHCWIYPRLERRYGAGVTLTHIVSPRRLWAGCWFRRGVFAAAACLMVLLGLCAFFRVWSPADLRAYLGMACECHPVWRQFAFRNFGAGHSADALFQRHPPSQRDEFGRYGVYSYFQGDTGGMHFTGFTIVTKDGKLLSAGSGSCTWGFSFFHTEDAEMDRQYTVYLQSKHEESERLRLGRLEKELRKFYSRHSRWPSNQEEFYVFVTGSQSADSNDHLGVTLIQQPDGDMDIALIEFPEARRSVTKPDVDSP